MKTADPQPILLATSQPTALEAAPVKLLGIADLHGNLRALQRILADNEPPRAILLAGDLTHFGTPDEAESVVRAALATGATVLAVAGNCDSPEINARLAELGVLIDRRNDRFDELHIQGLSGIPPWMSRMYQFTEEQLEAALKRGRPKSTGIRHHCVLAHVPPRDMPVDRTWFGRHVGSTALRAYIETAGPSLVVCGHVHEARGVARLGRTTVVNCGYGSKGHYALFDLAEPSFPSNESPPSEGPEPIAEIHVELCRA